MTRFVVKFSLALVLILVAVAGVASAGDDKCTIATKGDSPTAQACAKGAVPRPRRR